jgi:predicted outer membrane repeat protein
MRGRTGVRGKAAARGAVVIALVAAGVAAPSGAAMARSLFPIGCDETSDSDESALIAAVTAANDEAHHPGEDVIQLTQGCTYTLETPVSSSYPRPGLPQVTSTITVWGNGATIQGPAARYGVDHFFFVDDTGNLSLTDLTLAHGGVAVVLGGAAVYNQGFLTLDGVTVDDFEGGAVAAAGSTTVKDSALTNNRILNYHGAAISAYSSLIVQNSRFEENFGHHDDPRVSAPGAAIYLGSDAGGLVTGSTFVGNDNDASGGAIYSLGSLAVTRSAFVRNTTTDNGGAIYSSGSVLTVTDSYFEGNVANGGGAVTGWDGSNSVSNSTFYANTSGGGGGIRAHSGSFAVRSSTFSSNVARVIPGAALWFESGATPDIAANVLAGQTNACNGLLVGDWNLLDAYDASCPGNMLLGDPKLAAPADNGGPTKTMRLGSGSAAVDRFTTGCPSKDQRGFARPAGGKCDIGAYEDQAPTVPGTPAVTAGANPSKTGTFTLGWTASTDADDTVSYRVLHKDANDAGFSVLTTTSATSTSVTEPEGTWTYVVEARDGNHAYDSGWSSDVVVDKSSPLTPTVAADRSPDYAPATGTSWFKDSVTVSTTSNGDPALADSSAGSGVASVTAPATYSTSGAHTYTGTATDAAGNTSPSASLTVSVDADAPAAGFSDCPTTVLLKHTASTSWTASDPSSGLATPASGSFTLDTATIGHKGVTTTATDNVGHSTPITCGYDVVYDFSGFFTPLANAPAVVKASAGKSVLISFSLAGNQGLGIMAPGFPASLRTPCTGFGEQTTGTPTTAIKPGLVYASSSGGRYQYLWKTEASWRGTCRQLVVKLNDGTYHRANVSFG